MAGYYVEARSHDGTVLEASDRFKAFDDAFDWLAVRKGSVAGWVLKIAGPLTPEQRGRIAALGVGEAG